MDFRISPTAFAAIAAGDGYQEGTYDLVSLAGAGKDILSSDETEIAHTMKQIELSAKLHGIQEVAVYYHDNCGAYGISDPTEEEKIQRRDLRQLAAVINQQFPALMISTYIIRGTASGQLASQKVA